MSEIARRTFLKLVALAAGTLALRPMLTHAAPLPGLWWLAKGSATYANDVTGDVVTEDQLMASMRGIPGGWIARFRVEQGRAVFLEDAHRLYDGIRNGQYGATAPEVFDHVKTCCERAMLQSKTLAP